MLCGRERTLDRRLQRALLYSALLHAFVLGLFRVQTTHEADPNQPAPIQVAVDCDGDEELGAVFADASLQEPQWPSAPYEFLTWTAAHD